MSYGARALKQLGAAFFYRTGMLSLWWRSYARRRRRQPLVVMYHRVLDPADGLDLSQPGLVVTTPTFERQLDFLRRFFRVVPLNQSATAADAELCSITFDDGWSDNHAHALPVLRRLGLPATIFVTTGFIGTRSLFWPERLTYLLQSEERRRLNPGALDGLRPPVSRALLAAAQAPDAALSPALDVLIEEAKAMGEEEREQLLEIVAEKTGRNPASLARRVLTWDQVSELDEAGLEIGSHGVTHTILTRIDHSRAVAEIHDSRRELARVLGKPPESFAYPNGESSPELAHAVRESGYARAVIAEEPPPAGCPPRFALQRKNLAEGSSRGLRGFSTSIFACEVLGFFDVLRRGRR